MLKLKSKIPLARRKKMRESWLKWYGTLSVEQKSEIGKKKAIGRKKKRDFWHSPETIQKMIKNHKGSTGKTWTYPWDKKKFVGNDKDYLKLHYWVYRNLPEH